LNAATGVFILGSTEPHYTPSKVYQAVLAEKPILAVLHSDSSAVKVIQQSFAGQVLTFKGEEELNKIKERFVFVFNEYKVFSKSYSVSSINRIAFDAYTARAITEQLAALLEKAILV
jgi:hypothetical protein